MASNENGHEMKDQTIFMLVNMLNAKEKENAELKRKLVTPIKTEQYTEASTQTADDDINMDILKSALNMTAPPIDVQMISDDTSTMVFHGGMIVTDSATPGLLLRQGKKVGERNKSAENDEKPILPSVVAFNFQPSFQWLEEKLKEVKGIPDEQRRRRCLKQAITENCKDIVDILPWKDSCLPDFLDQHDCLLKEEHLRINRHVGKMNQIRCLITILLNKDYRSMLVFITFILEFDPDLGAQLLDAHSRILNEGESTAETCTSCSLVDRIDITQLIDDLFSKEMIDQHVYCEVIQSDGGRLRGMWEKLQRQVRNNGNHKEVSHVVVDELSRIECHSDIVQMLRNDMETHTNSFICRCSQGIQMQILKPVENGESDGETDSN